MQLRSTDVLEFLYSSQHTPPILTIQIENLLVASVDKPCNAIEPSLAEIVGLSSTSSPEQQEHGSGS